jgi:hypothetical protein
VGGSGRKKIQKSECKKTEEKEDQVGVEEEVELEGDFE